MDEELFLSASQRPLVWLFFVEFLWQLEIIDDIQPYIWGVSDMGSIRKTISFLVIESVLLFCNRLAHMTHMTSPGR